MQKINHTHLNYITIRTPTLHMNNILIHFFVNMCSFGDCQFKITHIQNTTSWSQTSLSNFAHQKFLNLMLGIVRNILPVQSCAQHFPFEKISHKNAHFNLFWLIYMDNANLDVYNSSAKNKMWLIWMSFTKIKLKLNYIVGFFC